MFYDPSTTLTYGDQDRNEGDNIERLIDDIKRQYVHVFVVISGNTSCLVCLNQWLAYM